MEVINRTNNFSIIFISVALSLAGCNSDSTADLPASPDMPEVPVIPEIPAKGKVKNVILMISDGTSDGAWDLASYWTDGKLNNNTYPYTEFDTLMAMNTSPLNATYEPAPTCSEEEQKVLYEAVKVWDDTPIESNFEFAGYDYLNKEYTDSAAAATAFATGHKTYGNAMGVDYCGEPLESITTIAKRNGLSTGIITSVPISHATPGAFAANNLSRHNYSEISRDMFLNGKTDLIMGTGHPAYDGQGNRKTISNYNYKYIGQDSWEELVSNTLMSTGSDKPWHFIEKKSDFEKLANNEATAEMLDGPLLGLVQSDSSTQQARGCSNGQDGNIAFACDFLPRPPTLEVMTKGAINYLSQNENGFFLMVEGGAVDWAAHGNHTARIIEELVEFNASISAVMAWVEENSSWDETLLIVTTDHGNAYVLGETSDQVAYAHVENPGKGVMPIVKYYSGNHTRELVRLYAKGNGADKLKDFVKGNDPSYVEHYNNIGSNGDYVNNSDVFEIMKQVVVAQ